jgi:type II secretory pathway component PulF
MKSSTLAAVGRFAFSMRTCLNAGMGLRKALELSGTTVPPGKLAKAIQVAAEGCERGLPISDGLEKARGVLPHFVVPVIRAGEMSGRLVEAFELIQDYSERLGPTLKLVRNTWLYPLICMVAGATVRTAIFLYFGMWLWAWRFVRDTTLGAAWVALVIWCILNLRLVRSWVDPLLLQIPGLGKAILRLSVILFFSTLRLAYEAGGMSVLSAFDLALATVRNSAVRQDLARARPVLEKNGAFQDAFSESLLLSGQIQESIAVGALSGQLGPSFGQIVRLETLELDVSLQKFNAIYQRVVGYGVAMSIVGTLLLCLSYSPK